ncbi:hypothetical protein U91I_01521 [alpha proteobacterium U9-1i]|nr:hypothetical protein U91I_01521 [alpha proteobacterium U9-1i]
MVAAAMSRRKSKTVQDNLIVNGPAARARAASAHRASKKGTIMFARTFALAGAAFVMLAGAAHAAEYSFRAELNGATVPTITGSAATGEALVRVHTETQTVDLTMNVSGLSLEDLYDHVIHSGVGPVHLHLYAADGDISLLVPFPYGASYTQTAGGFSLNVSNYSYAEGAAALRSNVSFDDFVATLGSEFVYINIHTDRVNDGEISGRLVPAS